MKLIRGIAIFALAAAALLALPKAQADTNWGTMNVKVWVGNGVPDVATITPNPILQPFYSFTYSGPLNFVNNNGQGQSNTFGEFFGANAANIGAFSGPTSEAAFLGTTMSIPGFAYNAYMLFTGTYTNPLWWVTLSSDDGSSLYVNGSQIIGMPNPQSLGSQTALLPQGSNPFQLVYVESNGGPSVLEVTTATPEPGSLLLLGTGLLGLAVFVFRKAKQPMFMPRW